VSLTKRKPWRDRINPLDLIAAAKARRINAGFVASNGIACRNDAEVAYYNVRDMQPRDSEGRIVMTPELRAMKAAVSA